jgi:hypothetical protein
MTQQPAFVPWTPDPEVAACVDFAFHASVGKYSSFLHSSGDCGCPQTLSDHYGQVGNGWGCMGTMNADEEPEVDPEAANMLI